MPDPIRILILGATGMLGHRLANGLTTLGHDVISAVREANTDLERLRLPAFKNSEKVLTGIDALDWRKLQDQVKALRPDVVINCIGMIKQNATDESATVHLVALNALLPHALADATATYGGKLIHFSTDCVFDGSRGNYREDDSPDATDLYGRSKAMGEVTCGTALTLRTSIIGPELRAHRSLVGWFLSQRQGSIRGYANAMYSGITTREMVHVIQLILTDHRRLTGLYHIAADPISKYDLLVHLNNSLGLGVEISKDLVFSIDRSMCASEFEEATGYKPPSWESMVAGLADDIRMYWNNGWMSDTCSNSAKETV